MQKTMRFDTLENFAQFKMTAFYEEGNRVLGPFQKVSARKAAPAREGSGPDMTATFSVKPSADVIVEVPDPVPPTPEKLRADLERRIELRLQRFESERQDLAQFSKNFAENPLHAFAWDADRAVTEAARVDVAAAAREFLRRGGSLDALIAHAHEQVFHGGRFPHRSTSPFSNLVAEAKVAAWADLVADLDMK